MKRNAGILASLAALGLLGYLGNHYYAQAQNTSGSGAAPSRPKTAIATFNLSYVMENCDHAKHFIEESKGDAKSLEAQLKPMLERFEKLKKSIAESPENQREQYRDQYKKLEREIKDFEDQGREQIKKKSDAQIKILYKEIEDAVVRLAKYRNIELVMHYNDFVGELKDQPGNIRNKFINAPLFPMYSAPGIDITKDLITMLNRKTEANKSTTPSSNSGS